MVYDVAIIGAGVTGAFVARSLSRYRLSVCILEKGSDIAMGASKANSGIVHAGYDAELGTLKALLNARGNSMMGQVCRDLGVPYKNTGSLVIAFDEEDRLKLEVLLDRGRKNGIRDLEILDSRQVRHMVPNISEKVSYALYAGTAGIVCPYELTLGAVENAIDNGCELRRDCEVTGIRYDAGAFTIDSTAGLIKCRFIVNAAGVYADNISRMAGDCSFAIKPRKGQYLLLDKSQGGLVDKVIFQTPTDKGKGILVTPTVDGNLLIGPDAVDTDDRNDSTTSAESLEHIKREALRSVPCINLREVITSFAGLRAASSTKDFIIAPSGTNPCFIHAAGIDSPGLTSAPAIGEYVTEILERQGLSLAEKADFNHIRKPVARFRELGLKEMEDVIKRDPRYGRIVCRCERITEAEVVDCIRRPAGARDLDGVKRRTRIGMGRCQGGFCTPRIVDILSRELGIQATEVTKSGGRSVLLYDRFVNHL